jgi:hypothetical protein
MTDEDVMLAYLENKQLEASADYVRRGRHLADVDSDELQWRWIADFKAWATNVRRHDHKPREDIESELIIRGQPFPFEAVTEEWATILAANREFTKRLESDPALLTDVERKLVADVEAFHRSLKDAPQN